MTIKRAYLIMVAIMITVWKALGVNRPLTLIFTDRKRMWKWRRLEIGSWEFNLLFNLSRTTAQSKEEIRFRVVTKNNGVFTKKLTSIIVFHARVKTITQTQTVVENFLHWNRSFSLIAAHQYEFIIYIQMWYCLQKRGRGTFPEFEFVVDIHITD